MMKRIVLYVIICMVAGVQLSAQDLTFKDESLADVLAAIFIAAAFLGGLAWAFAPLLRTNQTTESPQPPKVSAPSLQGRAGGESSISFSNLRLDSILTIVSAHYECEVCFRDTTAQALRLSTVWDREDSLSVFLETLNEFDGLRLTDERDTIFVESIMEEDK